MPFLNTYRKEPVHLLGQLQVEVWYAQQHIKLFRVMVRGDDPSGVELAEAHMIGLS